MTRPKRMTSRGAAGSGLLIPCVLAVLVFTRGAESASAAGEAARRNDAAVAVVPYQLPTLYSFQLPVYSVATSSANYKHQYKPSLRKNALAATLSPDEYEPVTFLLYHARKCAKLAISCSPLKMEGTAVSPPHLPSLEVRYAWPASGKSHWRMKKPVSFPFYLMKRPQSGMKEGTSTLVWLTVHASKKTAPGNYVAKVQVRVDDQEVVVLSLKVRVLPIALLEPDIPFGMYYNEGYNPRPYSSPAYQRKYFEDMKRHGMTSVTVYNLPLHEKGGKSWLDYDRTFRGRLGLSGTMQLIADAKLVRPGLPVMFMSTRQNKPRNWFGDIPTAFLLNIKEKQEREKWPEFLFYLVDEPHDKKRQATLRAIWNDFYKALPKGRIRTITAIEDKAIEPAGRFYDIWVFHAARGSIPKYRDLAQKRGKELWVYECDSKRYNIAAIRCYAGYMTFNMGLQGNFQWVYWGNQKLSLKKDSDPAPKQALGWAYVLPSPSGPIPTVKWEARREGVDDYRYLLTLKTLVTTLKEAGKSELASEGENVLSQALKFVPPTYRPFGSDNEYDRRRRMVAQAVVKLQKALP